MLYVFKAHAMLRAGMLPPAPCEIRTHFALRAPEAFSFTIDIGTILCGTLAKTCVCGVVCAEREHTARSNDYILLLPICWSTHTHSSPHYGPNGGHWQDDFGRISG